MTCKDCIYEKICDNLIAQGLPWKDGKYPAEKFCDQFKNKADVVEVRHGHWIEHTVKPDWLEDDVEVFYNCSECGSSHWSIIPPYCPNCGAKMDSERSENETDIHP